MSTPFQATDWDRQPLLYSRGVGEDRDWRGVGGGGRRPMWGGAS
jgi:hypothetical protein